MAQSISWLFPKFLSSVTLITLVQYVYLKITQKHPQVICSENGASSLEITDLFMIEPTVYKAGFEPPKSFGWST